MLDTRGSGKEYSRSQINRLTKLADLYTNDNRGIYAELLCDSSNDGTSGSGSSGCPKVYFREWLTSHGMGDSCSFAIVNSLSDLKEELKKDVDHGDLAPGKLNRICDEMMKFFVIKD